MPGPLLTTASKIMCPHGGTAVLKTSNSTTSASAARVLLESDVHDVFGCSFTIASNYRPCRTIEWSAGASKVKVDNTRVLLRTSVGACKSGEGITQGIALITYTQQKAKGL